MFGIKPQKKGTQPDQVPAVSQGQSTQSWMPIEDVNNGFIHRKDGTLIAVVHVQPTNFDLLTENEKIRKIKVLEEVLNGLDYPYQILSIARPVDLDAYIASMADMRKKVNTIKSRLLSGYIKQAADMATSGEALERHFYILISQAQSKNQRQDEAVLIRRATDLATSLTAADLVSHVCNDGELRNLLFVFANPNQAAYERAPDTQVMLPSIFVP